MAWVPTLDPDASLSVDVAGPPAWGTAFVGRTYELERLRYLLSRPECRLINLFGPGGIGKTRLAVEFLTRHMPGRRSLFVPLEAAADLEAGIVEGLSIGVERVEQRVARIAAAIGDSDFALVLDNFEHLASQSEVLVELLDACRNLRVIVTSRVILGITHEWVLPVGGLPHLSASAAGAMESSTEALLLFEQRYEQATGRTLDASELAIARRICARLEGIPLAIELAAAWSNTLPVAEIERDIRERRGILFSRSLAFPERQQSLHSVFDHSWKLLTDREQIALACLSVFSDGFDRSAAESIAAVDLVTLAALVDKSLVQRGRDDRFRMHPLMFEYAQEQLIASDVDRDALFDRHAAHYIDLLLASLPNIDGQHQLEAVQRVTKEWTNIRAAWEHILYREQYEKAARALYVLDMICSFRARYDEALHFAAAALRVAVPGGADDGFLRFTALLVRAWVQIRLGHLDESERLATEAEQLLAERGQLPPPGMHLDPLMAMATVALVRANFKAAEGFATTAVERSRRAGHQGRLSLALYTLENAYWEQGKHSDAATALEEAFQISEALGDAWFLAFLHNDLGRQATMQGNSSQAEWHLARSIELRTAFGDAGGRAIAEEKLAALEMSRAAEGAEQRLFRALALYRQVGDRGGIASVHAALGRRAHARGDTGGARARFAQALDEAAAMSYSRLIVDILVDVAELEYNAGDSRALDVLAMLATDSSTPGAAAARIQQVAARVPAPHWSEARRRANGLTLETTVTAVLSALRQPHGRTRTAEQGPERLSHREIEVLKLIAGGATNATIAASLGITVGTVKWYTSQILAKLGARNRTEAVARAREDDLLP